MRSAPFVWFLVGVFACVAVAAAATTVPKVVKYETKKGVVTFKHTAHEARIGKKCNTCHHAAKRADASDAEKCSACHKEADSEKAGQKVPSLKKSYHKLCKDCHKKNGKGPTKCKQCHVK